MLYRFFPFILIIFGAIGVWGQTPQSISFQKAGANAQPKNMLACQDQFAGTISFANPLGQSNDMDPDTIFLCLGDQFDIIHNDDDDLSGDPNMNTPPGITYGFFNCRPTVSGPDLTTILTDSCIIDNPPPLGDIWVTAGGNSSGNITFRNTKTLQDTFNGGKPVLIWFAPLTIDNFALKQYELGTPPASAGPCVNLNVNEAFAVVYLNELEVVNPNINAGLSGCLGTFGVRGGLPEFNGSDYTISIQLLGNPSVTGWVVNGPVTHGETAVFQVPVPGIYNVIVEDGKSCESANFQVNMSSCVNVAQSVQSGLAAPGDKICLDVTSEDGFDDIVSIQYGLTWDASVLAYDTVINLTPALPGFTYNSSFNNIGDSLIFSWGALSGNGVTIPDGQVLYQVCFDVVGSDGDCTDIEFIQGPITDIFNENGSQLGFYGMAGNVCVSNAALVIQSTQNSVNCPGASDGRFTITVTGGQAPYNVVWQNAAGGPVQGPATINLQGGSFTVNNLPAGTYLVTVTDAQSTPLIATEQVTVLSPPIFSVLFDENPGLCNGQVGSIRADIVLDSVIVVNPTANYAFQWGNGATTPLIANITSGSYSVTVTQKATGCTVAQATFLPQPPPLIVNITPTPATCSGIADGSLSVSVFGGTPDNNGDYVIQWPTIGAGITVVNTSSNVSGLESDRYQLIVTDNNGCFFQQNVFLPAIKVLSVDAIASDVSCNNECSGSIFVTGTTSGGAPSLPYNFDWFGTPVPPPPTNTTPTTSTLNNLCVGSYVVVMEDAAGCQIDTTFIISAPPALQVALVSTLNETCSPGDDGAITVAVAGGTYPYTYSWNGPSNDSIATGLNAGVYTVTVEDANNCFDTLSATVTSPVGPSIVSLLDDEVSCPNSVDGVLTVVAFPGNAPISGYKWSNGSTQSFVAGVGPGEYVVTVTDANSCASIDTAVVTAPPPLVRDSANTESPLCPGLSDGSVAIFISGGTMPYQYQWSNGSGGMGQNVIINVPSGNYTVTITDDNNCPPLTETITLEDPPAIVAQFSSIDSVSCANTGITCDGTATATASYSDGAAGIFNFIWQNGESNSGAQTSTAVQLCAGPQILTISDGICTANATVVIPAPLPILPGQQIQNVSCNGLSDGEIILLPTGGTPPYNILWEDGTTVSTLSNLPAGNYTALISDSKNCTFTHTISIIEPAVFGLSIVPDQTSDVSCAGDEDGVITVVAQGGNINLGGVVYLWENGVAPPSSNTAVNLAPGTYSVIATDVKGCADSLTQTINEPLPIQFALGEIMPILCFGQNTFLTVDSVWGGRPTTYQFSVDGGINRLPGDPSPVFAGDHKVTVVDIVNGCEVDTTITIDEPQEIIVELPAIVEIELGDSLTTLDPEITSSLPIDSFIWEPGNQLSCTNCKNPRVLAIQDQLYTLTIVDANGCSASAQVLLDVDRNRNVYVPNIFSPNGDGVNDKFQVYTGIGVTGINFIKVYDRWGELMFEEADLPPSPNGTPGWNGTFNGEKMNPAVFMYLIEVRFLDEQVLLYRGDVTLIR